MTRVLFQMWRPFRESLVTAHLFYVEQAANRLLSQFEDIESEADNASERWLDENGRFFDPERHDPGDFYEAAHDTGIEFYQLLSEMRDQTRLSVVAGIFHQWDKQLRDWLVRETFNWHKGQSVCAAIWNASFDNIFDLLSGLGWNARAEDFFTKLDACRLVVNVYKHGDGPSFTDLLARYPEYLDRPASKMAPRFGTEYLDHSHLRVSSQQIQEFSDAIVEFWGSVPENVLDSEVSEIPDWFEKAIIRDRDTPK